MLLHYKHSGCKDIRVIAPNTLLPYGFDEYGEGVRLFNNMEAGIQDLRRGNYALRIRK